MVLVGNREYNTERGFKNQLHIELGLKPKNILRQIRSSINLCWASKLIQIGFSYECNRAGQYFTKYVRGFTMIPGEYYTLLTYCRSCSELKWALRQSNPEKKAAVMTSQLLKFVAHHIPGHSI